MKRFKPSTRTSCIPVPSSVKRTMYCALAVEPASQSFMRHMQTLSLASLRLCFDFFRRAFCILLYSELNLVTCSSSTVSHHHFQHLFVIIHMTMLIMLPPRYCYLLAMDNLFNSAYNNLGPNIKTGPSVMNTAYQVMRMIRQNPLFHSSPS